MIMRNNLRDIKEQRKVFIGNFVRYGSKNGYKGLEKTILLKDIKDGFDKILTNHLWFNFTKGFEQLGELKEGDIIQFTARSKQYEKGYKGYRDIVYKPIEFDYKLSHPTNIKLIGDEK